MNALSAGLLVRDKMGDVICVFKVTPEEPERFEEIGNELKKLQPERLEEEPIAFGLKTWKFTKIVPDEEGTVTELEEKLASVKGVQSVETVQVSRSL